MAYWEDRWVFRNSIEYEIKFAGNYGAKGEKRGKKEKATPEQIKKQNQRNRENRVRRTIKENFYPDDLWITLKYPAGKRKTAKEVEEDVGRCLRKLRESYKKRGEALLYYCRLEIGRRGGIHIHILINRLKGEPATDLVVKRCWEQGSIYWTTTYESGGYEKLANYIVKEPDEEIMEQLSFLPPEERKTFIRYSSSKNLVRPEPERKEYARKTVRKLLEEGAKPSPGFYIDLNSWVAGKNRYTGMSYIHYTEYRLQEQTQAEMESEREKRRKRALCKRRKAKRGVSRKKQHKNDEDSRKHDRGEAWK